LKREGRSRRGKMLVREEWRGRIEVRNQGADYELYPAGRCLGWDGIVV
jgi:hypothetical protein